MGEPRLFNAYGLIDLSPCEVNQPQPRAARHGARAGDAGRERGRERDELDSERESEGEWVPGATRNSGTSET